MTHYLLEDDASIAELLHRVKRVAVLGIKTEAHAGEPSHYVPRYLVDAGLTVVPVPVYFPEATHILGEPVYRKLTDVPGAIDLVDVFRKPKDVLTHLPDMLAAKPKAVWLQSGIRSDEAARELTQAGIYVVQDRCLMVEHRRLARRGS
jgi:predicted CoA-binding protein